MRCQATLLSRRPTHVAGLLNVLEDQQLFCRQEEGPLAAVWLGQMMATSSSAIAKTRICCCTG